MPEPAQKQAPVPAPTPAKAPTTTATAKPSKGALGIIALIVIGVVIYYLFIKG